MGPYPNQTSDISLTRRPGEKAREQKERQEREARNQELAGSSYQVPVAEDFVSMGAGAGAGDDGDQLSGVPWGGLNIQHMVAMGHESESRRGSRREPSDHQYDYADSGQYYDPQLMSPPYGGGVAYGGDDRYFDASASSPSYSFLDAGHDSFSGISSSSSTSSSSRPGMWR